LDLQIQPDLITVSSEFLGTVERPATGFAAESALSTTPFARLPRLERLKATGAADTSEPLEEAVAPDIEEEDTKDTKVEKAKMKMRGKNKSMKR
jgi:U3 small nucleolar RNA-associated protein 7